MKLYNIKLKIEWKPIYIYPFQFLSDWKYKIKYIIMGIRIKRHFKKLAWTEKEIRSMTSCCGSLNEAITHLSYRLTDGFGDDYRRYLPIARKLISKGFERGWIIIK